MPRLSILPVRQRISCARCSSSPYFLGGGSDIYEEQRRLAGGCSAATAAAAPAYPFGRWRLGPRRSSLRRPPATTRDFPPVSIVDLPGFKRIPCARSERDYRAKFLLVRAQPCDIQSPCKKESKRVGKKMNRGGRTRKAGARRPGSSNFGSQAHSYSYF